MAKDYKMPENLPTLAQIEFPDLQHKIKRLCASIDEAKTCCMQATPEPDADLKTCLEVVLLCIGETKEPLYKIMHTLCRCAAYSTPQIKERLGHILHDATITMHNLGIIHKIISATIHHANNRDFVLGTLNKITNTHFHTTHQKTLPIIYKALEECTDAVFSDAVIKRLDYMITQGGLSIVTKAKKNNMPIPKSCIDTKAIYTTDRKLRLKMCQNTYAIMLHAGKALCALQRVKSLIEGWSLQSRSELKLCHFKFGMYMLLDSTLRSIEACQLLNPGAYLFKLPVELVYAKAEIPRLQSQTHAILTTANTDQAQNISALNVKLIEGHLTSALNYAIALYNISKESHRDEPNTSSGFCKMIQRQRNPDHNPHEEYLLSR
jgi:hypothetical protein